MRRAPVAWGWNRIIVLSAWLWTAIAHAELTFPYLASVAENGARVYSGPGDEYYATDVLREGHEVEVYRHTPDGWLAIRPPDGSFSWVYGRHVDVLADGVGQINKARVSSRIGSHSDDRRNVIQVRLEEGERVLILGNDHGDDPSRSEAWYRIAPPPGEFRWMRADDLALHPEGTVAADRNAMAVDDVPAAGPPTSPDETDLATEADAAAGPLHGSKNMPAENASPVAETPNDSDAVENSPTTEDEVAEADAADRQLSDAEVVDTELADSGWVTAATHNAPLPATTSKGKVEASDGATAPAGSQQAGNNGAETGWQPTRALPSNRPLTDPGDPTQSGSRVAGQAGGSRNESGRTAGTDGARKLSPELVQKILALDVRLSQTISGEPRSWQLDALERTANTLLGEAETVAERQAAQHALQKISRFAAIQSRFEQAQQQTSGTIASRTTAGTLTPGTFMPAAPVSVPTGPLVPGSPMPATPAATAQFAPPGALRRYDAVGKLHAVTSQRPGAPQFALVDDAGQVVSFVTPTPDVNLTPYVGQRVGVAGRRGYLPEFGQHHVTAGRVVPLPYLR